MAGVVVGLGVMAVNNTDKNTYTRRTHILVRHPQREEIKFFFFN